MLKKLHLCICLLALVAASPMVSAQEASPSPEPFELFIKQFTGSAAFQYSRIKFPLRTAVSLRVNDEGDEREFPFTKEMWPLLGEEMMRVERTVHEEGGTYVGAYLTDEDNVKEFLAGYEESEPDVRVRFERLADGKWYVVDAYTAWYSPEVYADELKEVIKELSEENSIFRQQHP